MKIPGLGITDIVAMCGMLLISLGIGLICGLRSSANNKDFLMAGKSMTFGPMSFSLAASYLSSIMLLGFPAEVYTYGAEIIVFFLGMFAAMITSTFLYIPVLYQLSFVSIYEYLEKRFRSRIIRQLASLTFSFQMILYMAIVLYAPTLCLQRVIGLPTWSIILMTGIICAIYTSLGGMKAVVWTDVFQVCIIFVGIIVIIVVGCNAVGGIELVFQLAYENGRMDIFNFDFNPFQRHSFWLLFFGQFQTWLSMYGCTQTQVQRYCSMKSYSDSWKTLLIMVPSMSLLAVMLVVLGFIIYAYNIQCDPITHFGLKPDAVLPHFVLRELTSLPGVRGIFVACLLSGSMSTLSSGLNSVAAVVWEDFFKTNRIFKNWSDMKITRFTKLITFVFGILVIALATMAEKLGSLVQLTGTINGMIAGPLGAIFFLALFVPFINGKGAIVGMLAGHVATLWISIGGTIYQSPHPYLPMPDSNCTEIAQIIGRNITYIESFREPLKGFYQIYELSYLLYPIIGMLVTVLVACIVSWITGFTTFNRKQNRYLHPLAWRFYQWYKGEYESGSKDDYWEKQNFNSPVRALKFNSLDLDSCDDIFTIKL